VIEVVPGHPETELQPSRYQVVLTWSDQDQHVHAEVPEVPGCTAHGPTYAETLAAALCAVDTWLVQRCAKGREPPAAHLRPLGQVRAELLRQAHADGRMHAQEVLSASTGTCPQAPGDRPVRLYDRWTLAAVAWGRAEQLIAEPVETDNIKALAEAYASAYVAGYCAVAREHGFMRLDRDDEG